MTDGGCDEDGIYIEELDGWDSFALAGETPAAGAQKECLRSRQRFLLRTLREKTDANLWEELRAAHPAMLDDTPTDGRRIEWDEIAAAEEPLFGANKRRSPEERAVRVQQRQADAAAQRRQLEGIAAEHWPSTLVGRGIRQLFADAAMEEFEGRLGDTEFEEVLVRAQALQAELEARLRPIVQRAETAAASVRPAISLALYDEALAIDRDNQDLRQARWLVEHRDVARIMRAHVADSSAATDVRGEVELRVALAVGVSRIELHPEAGIQISGNKETDRIRGKRADNDARITPDIWTPGTCPLVLADGTTLCGGVIRGELASLDVRSGVFAVIDSVTIIDSHCGITVDGGASATVHGGRLAGAGCTYGVYVCGAGSRVTVTGLAVDNVDIGIAAVDGGVVTATECTISCCFITDYLETEGRIEGVTRELVQSGEPNDIHFERVQAECIDGIDAGDSLAIVTEAIPRVLQRLTGIADQGHTPERQAELRSALTEILYNMLRPRDGEPISKEDLALEQNSLSALEQNGQLSVADAVVQTCYQMSSAALDRGSESDMETLPGFFALISLVAHIVGDEFDKHAAAGLTIVVQVASIPTPDTDNVMATMDFEDVRLYALDLAALVVYPPGATTLRPACEAFIEPLLDFVNAVVRDENSPDRLLAPAFALVQGLRSFVGRGPMKVELDRLHQICADDYPRFLIAPEVMPWE